jgi:AraC-like DNA-binding protein
MNRTLIISASPFLSAGIAALLLGVMRTRHLSQFYLTLFAGAVFFFSLDMAYGGHLGFMGAPVAVLGNVTCGMSWLLTRALFRPATPRVVWPWIVFATLIATNVIIELVHASAGSGFFGATEQLSRNVRNLISSTVLVLTLLEPVKGLGSPLPAPERRFRLIFIAAYASLVTVAVLMQKQSGSDQMQNVIKVSCALISLIVAIGAVAFRTRHPLPQVAMPKRPAATPEREDLQARILGVIVDRQAYKNPEIKVADVARMMGEPGYKVSQSINGIMGFQNFNRLINSFRIDCAKAMLTDAQFADWSILAIAMECGFGSIGPFNRAFKESIGTTPMQYRTTHRRESA